MNQKGVMAEVKDLLNRITMKAIVAVDLNWGIGYNVKLLQVIPDDMRLFRQMTLHKAVVMGRATFESLSNKKPLKDRINIVLSRTGCFDGVTMCHSLEHLFCELEKILVDEVYVIGGETIYKMLLPFCKEAYVTKIKNTYSADTYFINLDEDPAWKLESSSDLKKYNDVEYQFTKYRNKCAFT